MSDELNRLLRESFEYNMSGVHTAFPGTVESYDAGKRRADIRPYMKRKLPDGRFMDFPIITDVPVIFPGTKNFGMHFPLEKGDEALVIVCERSTDLWKDSGGTGIEDDDPRRFNLMDGFAIPGLQPKERHQTPDTGASIVYKEKNRILIDDDIITIENGEGRIIIDKDVIEMGNTVDTLGGLLDALLTALENLATEGSPSAHTAKTWATANITPLKQKTAKVFKK